MMGRATAMPLNLILALSPNSAPAAMAVQTFTVSVDISSVIARPAAKKPSSRAARE